MFRIGYNTNGLAHHRPVDALRLVHELGYEALALTPDPGCLDPFDLRETELFDLRRWAEDLGLELVVETGSRYLLDASRKHFPTLLEESAADRARRLDFLQRCADMAAALDASVVSIWSGAAPEGAVADWPFADAADPAKASAKAAAWDHLCEGTAALLEFLDGTSVNLAIEPEPGMFVASTAGYAELCARLGSASATLGLTLDVGHCLVTGDDVAATIREWAPRLVNVHLDDIKDGIHDHRMFGEGALDLATTLQTLIEVGFADVASVELSRDSHRGPTAAAEAMGHLLNALR
ncbi:MAG: sugar phosphate isomerase/epimerase [Planctomycetota bacterium]|nr:sugar phosphate isomerase/epimerase [Planctomycetota bacterium]